MLRGYTGFEKVGEVESEYGPPKPWFKFHTPQTITNQFNELVVVDYFVISTVPHLTFDAESVDWETMVFPCDEFGQPPTSDYSGIYAEVSAWKPNEAEVLRGFIASVKE
jgi:hypothetical protein